MTKSPISKAVVPVILVGVSALPAGAADFNIPGGDLKAALDIYTQATGARVLYAEDAVRGVKTKGVQGNLSDSSALSRILSGTGFSVRTHSDGTITITRSPSADNEVPNIVIAQATPPRAAVETVTVTSSKLGGADVQSIPIAITALSQEQLTSRQVAGGPDLVKEVPNLTFSKTNFTGYNIEIRGIGTQAISVTTDPAVAVAFNDIPFIRNHFFEQEFYDLSQAEVLRGPQGTLYGRNATAGVVNIVSAKPTDQFEAMASGDIGNYKNRRFEGMVNIPIVDDRLDLRVAGEWTKRDGYSFNEITNKPIDGRDLWSSRVTLGWKPTATVQTYLVWEHFQENDDRMRTAKQLCKTDPGPAEIMGVPVPQTQANFETGFSMYLSQGCLPTSLYSADAFEVPNGFSLPYDVAGNWAQVLNDQLDPYANATQSRNLRDIEAALNPIYEAKNDTLEFNADWSVSPALTFTSQTGFNTDFLWSTEDFNRFSTTPHLFLNTLDGPSQNPLFISIAPNGIFCDPQLGCSDRLVAQDLSDEHAWQLSQEFRLASNFSGPLNFSVGGNYLHYETEENYYVFINILTAFMAVPPFGVKYLPPWQAGVSDNSQCLTAGFGDFAYPDPTKEGLVLTCGYIDPNTIPNVNNQGHNYFLSQNPYALNSYAGFGEVYYNLTSDLKLTGGLRWTEDRKHFIDIPSELLVAGYGYPSTGAVDQQWDQLTGRAVANWTPKLDFTDQTLIYGSYSHGYKAGGANPPGAVLLESVAINGNNGIAPSANPIHPDTFKPEFIDAYELGTKNALLDGGLTLNGDIFFYNYKNYQISRIVDRTSINDNFNATVKGGELEASWEPAPGLKLKFAGGYEHTRVGNGQSSVDLMDRTAGRPGWIVVKPFVTQASNCVLPAYVIATQITQGTGDGLENFCVWAYQEHVDPVTGQPYGTSNLSEHGSVPLVGYPGFDPDAGGINPLTGLPDPYTGQNTFNGVDYGPVQNNGQGFNKNLSGNELPNAPHFTTSVSAEYTMPVSADWAATLHGDFYWQSQSWARVFNDRPYDEIRGYSTANLALILTSANGWQVMGYLKNVFNVTAITGDFLNSDDTGLTTNVFLTDPRLFGVRVTKNW